MKRQTKMSLFSAAGGGHQAYAWSPWHLSTWRCPDLRGKGRKERGISNDKTIKNCLENKPYRIAL
jgi:hypothetical protein